MNSLEKHPFITWFASNSVVANILMLSLLAAGFYTAFNVRKEGFPSFDSESVTVEVNIQGGTPENVERGVSVKIEEALQGVNGIDHIRSVSTDSSATLTIEARENYPIDKLLDDVKIQVDAIPSFPEQAEQPVVTDNKRSRNVLWIELYGDVSETVRKEAARELRDTLLRQPDITKVETSGDRDYEISIEPSEEKLRLYDLTFDELATAISNNSFDLGGGEVLTSRGNISLRSRDQAYTRSDFEKIPVRTLTNGTRILVQDVATVRDDFIDQQFLNRFRGKPTTSLNITTEGDGDIVKAVTQAREILENYQGLPPGIEVASWLDGSTSIQARLSLLLNNGLVGVFLVLGILMLFLNLRLAFWVAVGIPISLAGAVTLFPIPGLDLSINVISAFGFLVVLGIVVDDAIVIGESIYSEKKDHTTPNSTSAENLRTTVTGVSRVVTPATFGVITTIAAFLPLTQVSGRMGNVFGQIATTVIFCLIFSLVESKLILPAHLAHINIHKKPRYRITKLWSKFQSLISRSLDFVITRIYGPIIKITLSWRYAILAGFIFIFIITIGLFPAGQIRFVFFPTIYEDNASVVLELEQGQSVDYLHQNTQRIADIATKMGKEYQKKYGHNPFKEIQISASSNNKSSIVSELTNSSDREFLTTPDIIKEWRKRVGTIAGSRSLAFAAKAGPPGGDIQINLESDDLIELQAAADALKEILKTYPGVYEIADSFDSGKPEIQYNLTSVGQAANLTKRDLAQNVRDAFFGREAQRVQRGRDEVKVMVRYPLEQRQNLNTLRNMRIRKTDGTTVPFSTVADTEYSESLASIERYDYKRIVSVTASIDKASTSSSAIQTRLTNDFYPTLGSRFPNISISESGDTEQRTKSIQSLQVGLIFSVISIYILIAIPLSSYVKPLVIMSVIPFGIIGAILGHYLLGIPLSILSIFGILALSGVVVNDSLVLVCRVDDLRSEGISLIDALSQAGTDRFRAILLTTLTTFFGLAPLLLETQVQAQFLKPMATSLAFGILFATIITLFLLPALMLILQDLKNIFSWHLKKPKA